MNRSVIIFLSVLLMTFVCFSCAATRPDTGITGLTVVCNGQNQAVLDCNSIFEQFIRTFRADIGIFLKTAAGLGIGAKKLMSLDSISSDMINHSRNLCIQLNNCMISKAGYIAEMKALRQAQLKIREANRMSSEYAADFDDEDNESKTDHKSSFENLFSEVLSSLTHFDVDSNEKAAVSSGSKE